jgi:hypothetical protein
MHTDSEIGASRQNDEEIIADLKLERQVKKIEAFDAMFAQWHTLHAAIENCAALTDMSSLDEQLNDMERLICTTPAPRACDVMRKFLVLKDCMATELRDGPCGDGRSLVMLAGIMADTMRFFDGPRD